MLSDVERSDIGEYVQKACCALGRYFKDRGIEFEGTRERDRIDPLIQIFKEGYESVEPFTKRFPEYSVGPDESVERSLILHLFSLLGFKVLTGTNRQAEFGRRLEEEVLKS